MKIIKLNMMHNGSTGKIMLQIAKKARERGHQVKTFSTNTFSLKYKKLPVAPEGHEYCGSFFENAIHYTLAQFFYINFTIC